MYLKSCRLGKKLQLTPDEWKQAQADDPHFGPIVELLKAKQLQQYKAYEDDLTSGMRVLLKYQWDLCLKNSLVDQKVQLKNHQLSIQQFVLPKPFCKQVILACHDELIHLDFLTIGKEGSDKNVNILVTTDIFTQYSQAFITPKQTAPCVAKTLWENFLVHYGWPKKIITDQGKSFENQLVKELCDLAEVQNCIPCHIDHKQMVVVSDSMQLSLIC